MGKTREKLAGAGEGAVAQAEPSLDMTLHQDRVMLSEAIRRSWRISPERKDLYLGHLDRLMKAPDPDPGLVVDANRILQQEQASALKDLHKLEEYDRLDQGKPVAGSAFTFPVIVERLLVLQVPEDQWPETVREFHRNRLAP